MKSIKLIDYTKLVYVVAHNELTDSLEGAFKKQGFEVSVQRGPYTELQRSYSAQMRCLVNHANVWRSIVERNCSAIVVEADFVPCKNFAALPAPMPLDSNGSGVGFAWLYSGGSTLYGFDPLGFPYGHGNTLVAYLLTPTAATSLLRFFDEIVRRTLPGAYSPWDSHLGIFLRRKCGILNYLPVYQYGEHGGVAQPEHGQNGLRAWHQADILARDLEFLPMYARGSHARFLLFRCRAYARGWARLLLLRFFNPKSINSSSARGRLFMAWYSVSRLLRMAAFGQQRD